MRAVFLDVATIDPDSIDMSPLSQLGLEWTFYPQTSPAELLTRAAGAEVLVTNKVALSAKTLADLPDLRLICVAATGMDHIDLDFAQQHGIQVKNVPAYSTQAVAERALLFILLGAHQIRHYDEAVRHQRWAQSPIFTLLDRPFREVTQQTLGIIGYGEIGACLANWAQALGMRVLIYSRRVQVPAGLDLKILLQQADFVSLHCPLTPDTRHLINAQSLSWMPPHAFLINTARGGLIDELALEQALAAKQIGGAALDVLSVEPPPPNHPLCQGKLDNLWVTPHNAFGTVQARTRLVQGIADAIRSCFAHT